MADIAGVEATGSVSGGMKTLLRLEGLALFAGATWLYAFWGGPWWLYAVLFLTTRSPLSRLSGRPKDRLMGL